MTQHEYNTRQHDTTRDHTRQHDTARVQDDKTRGNTSTTRVQYDPTEVQRKLWQQK